MADIRETTYERLTITIGVGAHYYQSDKVFLTASFVVEILLPSK